MTAMVKVNGGLCSVSDNRFSFGIVDGTVQKSSKV